MSMFIDEILPYAALQKQIGDKSQLETEDKSSIVTAINEVLESGNNFAEYAFKSWLQAEKSNEEPDEYPYQVTVKPNSLIIIGEDEPVTGELEVALLQNIDITSPYHPSTVYRVIVFCGTGADVTIVNTYNAIAWANDDAPTYEAGYIYEVIVSSGVSGVLFARYTRYSIPD